MATIQSFGETPAPRRPSSATQPQGPQDTFVPSTPAPELQPRPQPPMEKELKFGLPDKAGYDALRGALGQELETLNQTNYYLISPTSSQSKTSVLRVRQENDQAFLTLKLDGKTQDGYQQSKEYEIPLPPETAERLKQGKTTPEDWRLEPLQKFEETFGREPLTLQGQLHNLRRCFALPTGETAELDCLTLPNGRVDYEIEVETKDPGPVREHLGKVFTSLGLPLEAQKKSKYRRFLDSLQG